MFWHRSQKNPHIHPTHRHAAIAQVSDCTGAASVALHAHVFLFFGGGSIAVVALVWLFFLVRAVFTIGLKMAVFGSVRST